MANQQSFILIKGILFKVPVFGQYLRKSGHIPAIKGQGQAAIDEALGRLADGGTIIIFPEGTRIPHGEQPALRPGFAGLYKMLGLPVIPVAQDSGQVWPKGFVKKPGTIRVHIGEVIPPGLPRPEIEARVHEAINKLNP